VFKRRQLAARPMLRASTRVRGAHKLSSRIAAASESFFEPVHRVELTVPATTSNLGPGFDCFGLALNMHNRVIIERADAFSLDIYGEGSTTLARTEENIIVGMTAKTLGLMDKAMPPLRFECHNAVPPRRGLGSSSSAIVAGFAAGLAFGGKELYHMATKKLLLNLAASEESEATRMRHARIAPAIYGGLQISFRRDTPGAAQGASATASPSGQGYGQGASGGHWITQRVSTPDGLQCVLFVPDEEASTKKAREVLPASLSYSDVVFNVARASMLANCFATGQFSPMRYAMDDRLHQQHRCHNLFPYCEDIIRAALKAGAHGAFLSGAGPTVVAITGGSGIADAGSDTMSQFLAEAVSKAMHETAVRQGVAGSVHIAEPSAGGLTSAGYSVDGAKLW